MLSTGRRRMVPGLLSVATFIGCSTAPQPGGRTPAIVTGNGNSSMPTGSGTDGGDSDADANTAGTDLTGPLAVTSLDHVMSVGDPPVTVIEYGDFQCPGCGQFARDAFPTIRQDYVETGRIRWVFRHFPLTQLHARAEPAAVASECADAQFRFFAYHDLLFESQPAFSDEQLRGYAAQLGLNQGVFEACFARYSTERVTQDFNSGLELGVQGTPTFFIDGQMLFGVQTAQQMSAALDQALAARGR